MRSGTQLSNYGSGTSAQKKVQSRRLRRNIDMISTALRQNRSQSNNKTQGVANQISTANGGAIQMSNNGIVAQQNQGPQNAQIKQQNNPMLNKQFLKKNGKKGLGESNSVLQTQSQQVLLNQTLGVKVGSLAGGQHSPEIVHQQSTSNYHNQGGKQADFSHNSKTTSKIVPQQLQQIFMHQRKKQNQPVLPPNNQQSHANSNNFHQNPTSSLTLTNNKNENIPQQHFNQNIDNINGAGGSSQQSKVTSGLVQIGPGGTQDLSTYYDVNLIDSGSQGSHKHGAKLHNAMVMSSGQKSQKVNNLKHHLSAHLYEQRSRAQSQLASNTTNGVQSNYSVLPLGSSNGGVNQNQVTGFNMMIPPQSSSNISGVKQPLGRSTSTSRNQQGYPTPSGGAGSGTLSNRQKNSQRNNKTQEKSSQQHTLYTQISLKEMGGGGSASPLKHIPNSNKNKFLASNLTTVGVDGAVHNGVGTGMALTEPNQSGITSAALGTKQVSTKYLNNLGGPGQNLNLLGTNSNKIASAVGLTPQIQLAGSGSAHRSHQGNNPNHDTRSASNILIGVVSGQQPNSSDSQQAQAGSNHQSRLPEFRQGLLHLENSNHLLGGLQQNQASGGGILMNNGRSRNTTYQMNTTNGVANQMVRTQQDPHQYHHSSSNQNNNQLSQTGVNSNGGLSSAILNINTASDINIYNNQFIVDSTPNPQRITNVASHAHSNGNDMASSGRVNSDSNRLQSHHGSSQQLQIQQAQIGGAIGGNGGNLKRGGKSSNLNLQSANVKGGQQQQQYGTNNPNNVRLQVSNRSNNKKNNGGGGVQQFVNQQVVVPPSLRPSAVSDQSQIGYSNQSQQQARSVSQGRGMKQSQNHQVQHPQSVQRHFEAKVSLASGGVGILQTQNSRNGKSATAQTHHHIQNGPSAAAARAAKAKAINDVYSVGSGGGGSALGTGAGMLNSNQHVNSNNNIVNPKGLSMGNNGGSGFSNLGEALNQLAAKNQMASSKGLKNAPVINAPPPLQLRNQQHGSKKNASRSQLKMINGGGVQLQKQQSVVQTALKGGITGGTGSLRQLKQTSQQHHNGGLSSEEILGLENTTNFHTEGEGINSGEHLKQQVHNQGNNNHNINHLTKLKSLGGPNKFDGTNQFHNLVEQQKRNLHLASDPQVSLKKRNIENLRWTNEYFNSQKIPLTDIAGGGSLPQYSQRIGGSSDNLTQNDPQIVKQRAFLANQDKIIGQRIQKGRQFMRQKAYNQAIKEFTDILDRNDENNLDAIFYRAVAYLDQGNLQKAISEFWRIVTPTSPKIATQNLLEDQFQKTRYLKTQELAPQAYILLSISHKRLGEKQNAKEDLERCIDEFPNYPDSYLARGQGLLHESKFDRALKDFIRFTELNGDQFSGFLGTGDCLKALKKYGEAADAYTKAINLLESQKLKPNYEQLVQQSHMKRGLAFYHGQKYQLALKDFQIVTVEDTQNVKAHFYIGKILAKGFENGDSAQTDAILHFEQVAKYPDQEFYTGNALFQIAKLRLKQKNYYEAYHCLKRAADNNFQSKRMSFYKDFTEGVLYLIKRKIKKGVQILSDLLEILVNRDKDDRKKREIGKNKENKRQNEASNEDQRPAGEDQKSKDGENASTLDQQNEGGNQGLSFAEKGHCNYLIHQILLFRAYGYVAIEKYELAQEDIRKVKRYGKIDAATIYNKWLGKGILRMDHEDYLMASKFFTKAWKKFNSNKDPYCLQVISIVRSFSYSLSGYYIDQQIKFDKVLETKKFLDKAITNCDKKVKEPSLYFLRGLLYFHMHHFYEALQDFNTAIEQEEESTAQFFLARGRTYACLSILNEAMKDLSIALNLDETLQQGYIYRGKCAYLLGDNNLSFLDFQRLILSDPKNPMVHVYAGNLLMTTGAYSDAIKAFENADTVEPTAISAFQRVRCFCALNELKKAYEIMCTIIKVHPEDVLLGLDHQCISALVHSSNAVRSMAKKGVTPADIKNSDQALKQASKTFDELIETFQSDRLPQLKKKDSILNIQLIPNVERVKIEKAMVAHDFARIKTQLTEEQALEIPQLSVDLDEPVNRGQLRKLTSVSNYYENIFNLEDIYLYRGVVKFSQQDYLGALKDFDQANLIAKEFSNQTAMASRQMNSSSVRPSGMNTRNPSLQQYAGNTDAHPTLLSNVTDLEDVGLCSFNTLETSFNKMLCHLKINDKPSTLQKLNDLAKKLPEKYRKHLPILKIAIFDSFEMYSEAQEEFEKFKRKDPDTFTLVFKSKFSQPFEIEIFPNEERLCEFFGFVNFSLSPNSKLRSYIKNSGDFKVRLSFSMPFVKPPNMIPSVDEEFIQSEFNLKQIDAPMPEAPWIKRCQHGITFTNEIQVLENAESQEDRLKFKKFFDSNKDQQQEQSALEKKKSSTQRNDPKSALEATQKGATKSDFKGAQLRSGASRNRKLVQLTSQAAKRENDYDCGAIGPGTVNSAGRRLLDGLIGETLSDQCKVSLLEDSRILEEECAVDSCSLNQNNQNQGRSNNHQNNQQAGNKDRQARDQDPLHGLTSVRLESGERNGQLSRNPNTGPQTVRQVNDVKSEDSGVNFGVMGTADSDSDSEEIQGTSEEEMDEDSCFEMFEGAGVGLTEKALVSDSMVNVGENLMRENQMQRRQMKREIQPAILDSQVDLDNINNILPNQEETKAITGTISKMARQRYDIDSADEEVIERTPDQSQAKKNLAEKIKDEPIMGKGASGNVGDGLLKKGNQKRNNQKKKRREIELSEDDQNNNNLPKEKHN